uniref:Uncharacterized protein n=1 Tax=Leersia perrieri TaxID=77586 RepID=A0A0D9W2V7_9ORYZ
MLQCVDADGDGCVTGTDTTNSWAVSCLSFAGLKQGVLTYREAQTRTQKEHGDGRGITRARTDTRRARPRTETGEAVRGLGLRRGGSGDGWGVEGGGCRDGDGLMEKAARTHVAELGDGRGGAWLRRWSGWMDRRGRARTRCGWMGRWRLTAEGSSGKPGGPSLVLTMRRVRRKMMELAVASDAVAGRKERSACACVTCGSGAAAERRLRRAGIGFSTG